MTAVKEAFITMAIGDKYLEMYNRYFRPSQERFARETGRDLIVLTDYIDKSEFGRSRHPAWQALLMFKSPLTENYQRLCWIDGDIYVTTTIRDPFSETGLFEWGAVRNNVYNVESYAKSDLDLYKLCPEKDRPAYVLNLGFCVLSRHMHAKLLETIYYGYPEQPCYYNGPLSYHLLTGFPGKELDWAFNSLVPLHMNARGRGVTSIYSLVAESTCIHFCGGINYRLVRLVALIDRMRYLIRRFGFGDTAPAKRVV
jgi:hypothetical protein